VRSQSNMIRTASVRRWITSRPWVASDEGQKSSLHVGVVRHINPWPVLTAGTQHLIPGLHTREHQGAAFRVEGLVLTGSGRQVPAVHKHVGGEELRHGLR